MMKKRGFTLVELLATIVVIAIIALITTTVISNVIENADKEAFEVSVKSVFEAVDYYLWENNLDEIPKEGINITDKSLKLDNQKEFTSGKIIAGSDGETMVSDVTNGKFCANGTKNDLTIEDGNCNSVIANDKTPPTNTAPSIADRAQGVTITNQQTDGESGIDTSSYIFKYRKAETTTWETVGPVNKKAITVTDFVDGETYEIVTSVSDKAGNTAESASLIFTKALTPKLPELIHTESDWIEIECSELLDKYQENWYYYINLSYGLTIEVDDYQYNNEISGEIDLFPANGTISGSDTNDYDVEGVYFENLYNYCSDVSEDPSEQISLFKIVSVSRENATYALRMENADDSSNYLEKVYPSVSCPSSGLKSTSIKQSPYTRKKNYSANDVTLTAETPGCLLAMDYQWYKDNTLISGATGKTYTAESSGTYKVVVTYEDKTYTASSSVYIDKTAPTNTSPELANTSKGVVITNAQTDSESGIDTTSYVYKYKVSGSSNWETVGPISDETLTVTDFVEGTSYTVLTSVSDNAGNIAESQLLTFTKEKTPQLPELINNDGEATISCNELIDKYQSNYAYYVNLYGTFSKSQFGFEDANPEGGFIPEDYYDTSEIDDVKRVKIYMDKVYSDCVRILDANNIDDQWITLFDLDADNDNDAYYVFNMLSSNNDYIEKKYYANCSNSTDLTITSSRVTTSTSYSPTNVMLTAKFYGTCATPTYQWYKDGTAISGATESTYTASTTGTYKVIVTYEGNTYEASSDVYINKVAPSCKVSISGTEGTNSWYTSDVTINAADCSSTKELEMYIDGELCEKCKDDAGNAGWTQSADTAGTVVKVIATSNAGIKTPYTYTIKRDSEAPVANITSVSDLASKIKVKGTCTDATSQVYNYTHLYSENGGTSYLPVKLTADNYTWQNIDTSKQLKFALQCTDNAGNVSNYSYGYPTINKGNAYMGGLVIENSSYTSSTVKILKASSEMYTSDVAKTKKLCDGTITRYSNCVIPTLRQFLEATGEYNAYQDFIHVEAEKDGDYPDDWDKVLESYENTDHKTEGDVHLSRIFGTDDYSSYFAVFNYPKNATLDGQPNSEGSFYFFDGSGYGNEDGGTYRLKWSNDTQAKALNVITVTK